MKKLALLLTVTMSLSAAAQVIITEPGISPATIDTNTMAIVDGKLTVISGGGVVVYGTTSASAYRGDWGATASNLAAEAYSWGNHATNSYATAGSVTTQVWDAAQYPLALTNVTDGTSITNVNAALLDGRTYENIIGDATRILTYYVWGGSAGVITNTKLASLSSSALQPVFTNTASNVTNGMLIGAYSVSADELPDILSEGIMYGYANLVRTGNSQLRTVLATLCILESDLVTEVVSFTNTATITFPNTLTQVPFEIPIAPAYDLDGGLARVICLRFYALSGWTGETVSSLSQDGYLTRFEFPASPAGVFALESDLANYARVSDGSRFHSVWSGGTNSLYIVSPNGAYTNLLMTTVN